MPAKATSARSGRYALNFGSGGFERPESAKSPPVREGGLLSDDWPVSGGDPVALPEVAFEPFKKISPTAGADDEDVAAVVLVPLTAQITERAEGVQGARHYGLGYSKDLGQSADGMRSGGQVNQHQKRHLAIREVRFAGTDIGDQRPHPASQRFVGHCGSILPSVA
jgi:hypothetical protein